MNVVVLKYNAGNTKSVLNALDRIGVNPILTDKPELICSADKVIFPGVGHAETAMKYLESKGLNLILKTLKQPVLGICLGMQLMCRETEEGNVNGMGIFDVPVVEFPSNLNLKVPHMGWNDVTFMDHPLFKGMSKAYMYHVHSYYAERNEFEIGVSSHGSVEFASALAKNNFYAVQFHPEKSGKEGEQILENFIKL